MKVAIVHDWLTGMRGGERCLEAFLKMYPEADIFTLFHVPGATSSLIDARVKQVSFLNKIPSVRKYYRILLPLFPTAISRFDFSGYDLIISLSHAAAKNIKVPNGVRHVCFCFTPMRYIWDQAENYLGSLRYLVWPLISRLRTWDRRGASSVSEFVAISKFVAARIRLFYGRRAKVIYPALEQRWLDAPLRKNKKNESYFLYAGAFVPYKNVDLIVMAFNALGLPLIVAGAGPEETRLRNLAAKNIEFRIKPSDAEMEDLYKNARALVFAATEDFGLVPLESLACGTPVIAHSSGALRETLKAPNAEKILNANSELAELVEGYLAGVFFKEQTASSVMQGVEAFIKVESCLSPEICRDLASRFSLANFTEEWSKLKC